MLPNMILSDYMIDFGVGPVSEARVHRKSIGMYIVNAGLRRNSKCAVQRQST